MRQKSVGTPLTIDCPFSFKEITVIVRLALITLAFFSCFMTGILLERKILSDSPAEKAEAVEKALDEITEEINALNEKKQLLETRLPKIKEAAAFEEAMK